MAGPARMRRRHWGIVIAFILSVVAPFLVSGLYLYVWAADQYVSKVGLWVRTESASSPASLISGLGGGASDTEILYEFIQSQELVSLVNEQIDLAVIYSKPGHDPVFAYRGGGAIEDLTAYWQRMVQVFYDGHAGLIEIRVRAFAPEDAKAVADAIFVASSDMISELRNVAQEDVMRYASADLEQSIERLKAAREAMTQFRSRNLLVDPDTEVALQTGIMMALEEMQSDARIELGVIRRSASENDPRIAQAEQRLEVIERRIAEERSKLGTDARTDLSDLVSEYERLTVDHEFAEQSYVASLTAFDLSRTEAQHQSRYLVAYIEPVLAETPLYPKRLMWSCFVALFGLFGWALGVLIFYSIKDRR